ncbi:MAG: hypothetical protein LBI86_08015 [Treponema sp.]|jgi:hypothetical protein|nr:hypothetical protein [Treponema sp.]
MNTLLKAAAGFLMNPVKRGLFLLVLVGLFALGEFMVSGLVRRTFVFYSIRDGETTVEDRMLRRSSSGETDIRRYVEEALLGPVSPNSAPLFSRDTRLVSFMYRDGVVYADLSEGAVLPPPEGGDVYRNFLTLYRGIRRNFPRVRDVRLFAAGKEAFFEDFRRIFSEENRN